jgi:hypothetical protein
MNIIAAMQRAALAGLVAALTLVASSASAGAKAESRVAIDWRNVSDTDVQRCGLSRLRAGTLERLIADGHAVVDNVDSTGVEVRVSSVADGLQIVVESQRISRKETLRLSETCDATIVLEAISRIAELVREVQADVTSPRAPQPAAPPEREGASFSLSLDAAAKAADPQEFLLFGGGLAADWAASKDWQLGGRAELMGNARLHVTVFEASTAVTAGWQPARSSVGLHLEAGPLLHIATSEQLTALEMDAALGAGVNFSVGVFHAQLLAYVRVRRFQHRIDGEVAFDTEQAGLILRIGAQLFDS